MGSHPEGTKKFLYNENWRKSPFFISTSKANNTAKKSYFFFKDEGGVEKGRLALVSIFRPFLLVFYPFCPFFCHIGPYFALTVVVVVLGSLQGGVAFPLGIL